MKNILVVVAHPDDEVLGCGGAIARYSDEGSNVSVMILGEGVTSRDTRRGRADRSKALLRLKMQVKKAAGILGIKHTSFYDLPDNRFDTVALLDIVKLIEEEILQRKPEVIFTHSGSDLNIDHVITHRAVLTATRPVAGQPVKEIYAFEVPSSTEWAFGEFGMFRPDTFYDIESTIELKLKALEMYDSEIRDSPHPRSREAISTAAKRWGSMTGIEYAEVFETVRRML